MRKPPNYPVTGGSWQGRDSREIKRRLKPLVKDIESPASMLMGEKHINHGLIALDSQAQVRPGPLTDAIQYEVHLLDLLALGQATTDPDSIVHFKGLLDIDTAAARLAKKYHDIANDPDSAPMENPDAAAQKFVKDIKKLRPWRLLGATEEDIRRDKMARRRQRGGEQSEIG